MTSSVELEQENRELRAINNFHYRALLVAFGQAASLESAEPDLSNLPKREAQVMEALLKVAKDAGVNPKQLLGELKTVNDAQNRLLTVRGLLDQVRRRDQRGLKFRKDLDDLLSSLSLDLKRTLRKMSRRR